MIVFVVHYVKQFDEFDQNEYLEVFAKELDAIKYVESIGANWTSVEEKEIK